MSDQTFDLGPEAYAKLDEVRATMEEKLGRPVDINEALVFCINTARMFQDGTFAALMMNQIKPPD
ncbi:MAG: hypothetical protein OXP73_10015 [Chloroflexota bacterium]|nr:hypothetical protein [Chloroflexota bacterium]